MKKVLFIVAVFLLPLFALGQEEWQPVTGYSSMELNYAQSLWFNSSNAAGMAVNPLRNYNILSAQYHYTEGGYKLQQEGDKTRSLLFNTNGALQLGKFFLWGDFTFADNYVTGTTYNTNLYEPQSDMPYYVADPNKSDWKKQYYDMALKVALPVWKERLTVGAEVHYTVKRAAKQLDPRSIVHSYGITVKPSIVVKITNRQHAGVSLLYQNTFDRNSFTNSLSYHSEPVYIMKGLGNYSPGVVGGTGGIGVFYYPANQYGGSLQYSITGDKSALLLDITYAAKKNEAFESPTKPRRRGTTDNKTTGGTLQLIRYGNNTTQKITAEAYRSVTDGVEYVQEYNSQYEINQWITIAEYVKSMYKSLWASVKYDLFIGTRHDYSWKTGVKILYADRQDEYFAPAALFNAQNGYAELSAAKNFAAGASSKILLGLNVGYKLNISGEYLYNGPDPASLPVTDFYAKDLAYLTASYLQAGCSISGSFVLKSKSSVNINIDWQWINPVEKTFDRSLIKVAAAYIF
jgi:hypothetical protein